MSDNVLITPTLLDAFEFAVNAPPSWKVRAMESFVAEIKREKTKMPDWVYKGIAFEDTVYRVCEQKRHDLGSEIFQKVVKECAGGQFQSVFKRTLDIDGQEVLYYNKTDVAFPDIIKDIKTTLNYKGERKYLSGWQHILYPWASERENFKYIIVVWENENSDTLREYHTIDVKANKKEVVEKEIISVTQELFSYLKEKNLYEDYYFTFSNNRR